MVQSRAVKLRHAVMLLLTPMAAARARAGRVGRRRGVAWTETLSESERVSEVK
jgi:hypothetical protein